MTRLIVPENCAAVRILTDCQRNFVGEGEGTALIDWLKLNRSDKDDCTLPGKVCFEWESDSAADVLEISEMPDFAEPMRVICHEKRAEVGNFIMGTRYFWRVNGCDAGEFYTEDAAPRWMEVGGMSNVRDMGAWRTLDGRRVKQGLIFRGSEMDTHHTVTPAGIKTLRDEMGIRTDLDLRGEAVGRVTESPAGADVDYRLIPCKAYDEFMAEEQKSVCMALFEVLADESAYPIYFHCWGGADRTGTLALMLESVLGLSDADMLKDYELTSLSVWGERSRNSELFRALMAELDKYDGGSIGEKAISFLRSCGIADDTFEKLKRNLLV